MTKQQMVTVTFSNKEHAVKYEAENVSIRNGRTTMWGPIYIIDESGNRRQWTKAGNGGKRYDRNGVPVSLEMK